MLVVETIARIRREYFVKGKPIKEIVRDVKVSRNTVRKVIRSQATAFTYDRRVQPMPKLGPWTAELERMLEANETKSKRERLTLLRISEALEGLGYQPVEKGVIDRVSRHGEAYRGEGGFAILRDDEDDLNDQDGSSGRNKHEQGANSARHGLLRGAGADELAHQQR